VRGLEGRQAAEQVGAVPGAEGAAGRGGGGGGGVGRGGTRRAASGAAAAHALERARQPLAPVVGHCSASAEPGDWRAWGALAPKLAREDLGAARSLAPSRRSRAVAQLAERGAGRALS